MDKVTFITTLQEARHGWKAVLAQMDEQRLLQPGVVNTWSVKDVIAHVAWYEREMIPVMRTHVFAGSELWEMSTDERNIVLFQQNSQRPLQEILTEEEHIYADFFEAVQMLEDEDLNIPQRFKEMPEDWLPWQLFADNSFVHYQQHLPAVRQWVGHS